MRVPPQPFLVVGAAALGIGLWGGLARAGAPLPAGKGSWILAHGPLMVCGFLGTLISVERAAALGRAAGWLVPGVSAAATAAFLTGAATFGTAGLFTVAAAGLAGLLVVLGRRRPDLAAGLLVAGAVSWLVGNLLWMAGRSVPSVVPWWIGFLVLTIAGERLELSRFRNPSPAAMRLFAGITILIVLSLLTGLVLPQPGFRALGLSLLLLASWLLRNDIAAASVWSNAAVPRFTAVCLLAGFLWLGLGGLGALLRGNAMAGFAYDAVLHALFVGFVFSMIFGHAPIIFPALLRRSFTFRSAAYAPLALLHLSVALRIGADIGGWGAVRTAAAVASAVAILGYLALTAASLGRARPRTPSRDGVRA